MVNSCSLALVKVRLMSCLQSTSKILYFRISNQLFLISLKVLWTRCRMPLSLPTACAISSRHPKPISLHLLTISTHRDTIMSKSNMKEVRWMQSWSMTMWVTASERRSLEESFRFYFWQIAYHRFIFIDLVWKDSPLFDLQLATKVDSEAEHGKGFAVPTSNHVPSIAVTSRNDCALSSEAMQEGIDRSNRTCRGLVWNSTFLTLGRGLLHPTDDIIGKRPI